MADESCAMQATLSERSSLEANRCVPNGFPALRKDAPRRNPYCRGSLPDLFSPSAQEVALAQFDRDIHAASSVGPFNARCNTLNRLLELWGEDLLPLSAHKVRLLGASLKAGKYRSAAQYLSTAKIQAQRSGQELPQSVRLALTDAQRSCSRGIGPAKNVEGIPLGLLHHLPADAVAWVPGGPRAPFRALVAGTWWLTREVELSTTRASMVGFHWSPEGLVATWTLPASKTDQQALGQARSHGCCCNAGKFAQVCPAHALWWQRAALRVWYPEHHSSDGTPCLDLPLFQILLDAHAQQMQLSAQYARQLTSWACRPHRRMDCACGLATRCVSGEPRV